MDKFVTTPRPVRKGQGEGLIFFPGSFNPFTKGHADIVERALMLFDRVIVAVGYNEQKQSNENGIIAFADGQNAGSDPLMIPRLEVIRKLYADEPRVEVIAYTGLTVEAARQHGCCAILRSVRSMKDYEYELQMADINRRLTQTDDSASGIETVVLFARPELASVSSSVVRELQHFGQDVSDFLP